MTRIYSVCSSCCLRVLPVRAVRRLLLGVMFPLATLWAVTSLNSQDENFVKAAAQGGMGEVELAQLALKKTSRPDIKMFAHQLVTDHTKANDSLKRIAEAKQVKMPDGAGVKFGAEKARLTILSGRDFDSGYINAMVDDHQHDIAEFKKAAGEGVDSDVKKFAAQTTPILEEHLRMAKAIQEKLVTPNR